MNYSGKPKLSNLKLLIQGDFRGINPTILCLEILGCRRNAWSGSVQPEQIDELQKKIDEYSLWLESGSAIDPIILNRINEFTSTRGKIDVVQTVLGEGHFNLLDTEDPTTKQVKRQVNKLSSDEVRHLILVLYFKSRDLDLEHPVRKYLEKIMPPPDAP